jgi:hypothetical protein
MRVCVGGGWVYVYNVCVCVCVCVCVGGGWVYVYNVCVYACWRLVGLCFSLYIIYVYVCVCVRCEHGWVIRGVEGCGCFWGGREGGRVNGISSTQMAEHPPQQHQ